MEDYDALIEQADYKRSRISDISAAIACYTRALAISGPRDRYILQMIGVCHKMRGDYDAALDMYEEALAGANEREEGNILRDMAEVHSLQGHNNQALELLLKSRRILDVMGWEADHSATLGFTARVHQRQGNFRVALPLFRQADQQLAQLPDRKLELYNKLHFVAALSEAGKARESRLLALKTIRLAIRHGSPAHWLRLTVLMIGGYRLEAWLKKKLRK